MWRVRNQTQFAARASFVRNYVGREIWVVAVKCSFTLTSSGLVVAEQQSEPNIGPVYTGDRGRSSLIWDTDLIDEKLGTDVVVRGSAHAPDQRVVQTMDVEVRVASVHKRLRIVGDRRWVRSGPTVVLSQPEPFACMPLTYERAFGGPNLASEAGCRDAFDLRNPIGPGYSDDPNKLVGVLAPNVEDPVRPISSWRDRPRSVGLGALDRHWQPRIGNFVASLDARPDARRTLLARYNGYAPPDQQVGTWLTGGEPVELRGLNPEGVVRFVLPCVHLGFQTLSRDGRQYHAARMYSLLIDAEAGEVALVWVTTLDVQGRDDQLEETVVYEKTSLSRGRL